MKKLSIILDCDEVLMECMQPACEMISRQLNITLDKKDIKTWNMTDLEPNVQKAILNLIRSPEFVATQQPIPGSVEFIQSLIDRGHKVMVFSAVPPIAMGVRAEHLMRYYPIDHNNITLGGNKKYMNADILLDDNLENLEGSMCRYPVLFRQPWNENDKRFLSVASYQEVLDFVDRVAEAPEPKESTVMKNGRPGFLAIVGPTASGKSSIIRELLKDPRFCLVQAVTTRKPRGDEIPGEYRFVSDEEFEELNNSNFLLEHTMYAGNKYGLNRREVESIWASGRIPVKAMDIVGAQIVKARLGSRAVTVFIHRNREAILTSLLERSVSKEDLNNTVRRILSLDSEYQNEFKCDWTVYNNGSLTEAVSQILKVI